MIGLTIAQTLLSLFLLQAGATPAAYADRFVTVNGLRIHYLDWGNAARPPMILVHGIARHAHTFDHIAPHFARDYHVPFLGIRAVSDGQGDPLNLPGFPFQFFVYRQLAGNNAAAVTIAFLQTWAASGRPV